MSTNKEYTIKRQTLVDIANALREKTGKTELIKVLELDDAIKEINLGSSKTIIDVEASVGLPNINVANPNGIYRLYENVEVPVMSGSKDAAIPGPDSGKTVSTVKFNTDTTYDELVPLINKLIPGTSSGDYYVCYESDSNYIRIVKANGDGATKWHYSILARVNGAAVVTVWDCWVLKSDSSLSIDGTWALSEVTYNNILLTTKTNTVVGTLNETIKSVIYTTVENFEYVKTREYRSVHVIENGQYVELLAK